MDDGEISVSKINFVLVQNIFEIVAYLLDLEIGQFELRIGFDLVLEFRHTFLGDVFHELTWVSRKK